MKKIKLINIIILLVLSSNSFIYGDSNKETFKKAKKYFFLKKFAMAEHLLQGLIKNDPENAYAYSYLADIFLSQKKYDGALNLYKRAIDISPEIAENYFRLGQIYYHKKISNLAINNFQKAVEIDKTLKFSYYHIGLSFLMLDRDKNKTIESWKTYLRLSPEDPQSDKIRRVIQLLESPDFEIPQKGSDISIEEALLLGGLKLKKIDRKARDKKAGHESKKTMNKFEDIYIDDINDDLNLD